MAQTGNSTRDTDSLFVDQSPLIKVEYFHHQDLADLIISVGDGTSLRSFGVFKAALKAVSNKLITAIVELDDIKLEHINAPPGLPTVALPNDNARAFSLFLAILFQQQQKLVKVPTRSDLLALAQLCVKYDLLKLISSQVTSWLTSFKWPAPLYDHPDPMKWIPAHEKMLQASYILQDDIMFTKTLRRVVLSTLIGENGELVWDLEDKLPGTTLFVDQTLLPPGVAGKAYTTVRNHFLAC
jgi:hypothetical protein